MPPAEVPDRNVCGRAAIAMNQSLTKEEEEEEEEEELRQAS